MGKILVIELQNHLSQEESNNIIVKVRKTLGLKDNDLVFLIESSNINNIYWVNDNWFTQLFNTFRPKKLLKKLQKENK
jgi:hypothetical protein